MMLLPNGELAVVDIRKLRDYCLNPVHLQGKHKAQVFAAALGITAAEAERLQEMLLRAAHTNAVTLGEQDKFGQRYVLDFEVIGTANMVAIRSVWIIRPEKVVPHLVTCYIM